MSARHTVTSKRGVHAGPLATLAPVLKRWTKLAAEPSWSHRDAPWIYNERADLSLLAGAAWLKGGFAFEEYATRKRKEGSKVRGYGRADLWLEHNDQSYAVEAKHAWVKLNQTTKEAVEQCEAALERAWDDAGNLTRIQGAARVGLTFVAPWISRSKKREARERFRDLVKALVTEERAVAWVRRDSGIPTIKSKSGHAYLYPGVILLARRA